MGRRRSAGDIICMFFHGSIRARSGVTDRAAEVVISLNTNKNTRDTSPLQKTQNEVAYPQTPYASSRPLSLGVILAGTPRRGGGRRRQTRKLPGRAGRGVARLWACARPAVSGACSCRIRGPWPQRELRPRRGGKSPFAPENA